MSMKEELNKIVHSKWFPWALGGVAGLLVLYYFYSSGSSSSSASSGTSDSSDAADYAAAEQAYAQQQAQNAAIAAQQQQESDKVNLANATLTAQTQVAEDQNTTAAISAVGSTLSSIISAQSALPVNAMNDYVAQNQTALTDAASVAATADAAIPGALTGAAQVLGESYTPEDVYGAAVLNSGSVQAANSVASNFNSAEAASASVSSSAESAAASRTQSNDASSSSELGTLGTLGAIALLA